MPKKERIFFIIYLLILISLFTILGFTERLYVLVENKVVSYTTMKNFSEISIEKLQEETPQHRLGVVKYINSEGRLLLSPNTSQLFDGQWIKIRTTNVTINSKGLRDYEYAYKKPINTCRIALLGDSFTFGWGVELNETFAKRLEIILNADDKKFEVLNFGVPGYGLFDELSQLQEEVILFNPDIVVFMAHPNDLRNITVYNDMLKNELDNFDRNYPQYTHYNLTEIQKTRIVIKDLWEKASFMEKNASEETVRDYYFRAFLLSKEYNFTIGVSAFPMSKNFISLIKSNANKYGWAIIDLREINDPTKYDAQKMQLIPGIDNHPTPYAHQLIADKLYNEVNWSELCSKAFNESVVSG